ncbi:MAG TPA: ribonuclease III [Bacteroidia bacterium]|jgi:ribonuclease-3|nr:ribonuclease III [Bacteroidia bacterium]
MFNFLRSKNEKIFAISLKYILGFSPKSLSIYKQAFRHNSIAKEIKDGVKDSNERLEFLGDSVLSTIIADFLFKKYPYKDEGYLTKMRSKIVSRDHLNKLALKLGLNKLIVQSHTTQQNASMNGNAFEALVGAIFLDRGFSEAQNFILNRILKFHVDVEKIIETETDFKSKLIEWGQKEKKNIHFKIMNENNVGHDKQYVIATLVNNEIIAEERHFSKKKAEQLSAEATCTKLGIE